MAKKKQPEKKKPETPAAARARKKRQIFAEVPLRVERPWAK